MLAARELPAESARATKNKNMGASVQRQASIDEAIFKAICKMQMRAFMKQAKERKYLRSGCCYGESSVQKFPFGVL